MNEIWFVHDRDPLLSLVEQAIRKNMHCDVLAVSDADLSPLHNNVSPPDLLIIDLEAVQNKTIHILNRVNQLRPEAAIIGIIPEGTSHGLDWIPQWVIDDTVIRPSKQNQLSFTIDTLLQKISTLEKLRAVQHQLKKEMSQEQIVARSKPMRQILQWLPKLAGSQSTVLITGETGTGKELIARAIHYLGPRAGKPFITVDCGSIPENLVENELFGHVTGAYTGAGRVYRGLLQEAEGGTLFLDEVESLPLCAQTKFLRFLQSREFRPLGKSSYTSVDVRVVAATNTDLMKVVSQRLFREDLYYRLSVIPLYIPPLRQRKSDIPPLVHYLIARYSGIPDAARHLPETTYHTWLNHDWPGNVRELENKVQEWLSFSSESPQQSSAQEEILDAPFRSLAEVRRDLLAQSDVTYLRRVLSYTKGNISAAARVAKFDRKSFRCLLRKYGIDVSHFRS